VLSEIENDDEVKRKQALKKEKELAKKKSRKSLSGTGAQIINKLFSFDNRSGTSKRYTHY
jgi:hypothetical protein